MSSIPNQVHCFATSLGSHFHPVFVLNSTYLFKNQPIDAFDQVSKIFDAAFLLVSLNN